MNEKNRDLFIVTIFTFITSLIYFILQIQSDRIEINPYRPILYVIMFIGLLLITIVAYKYTPKQPNNLTEKHMVYFLRGVYLIYSSGLIILYNSLISGEYNAIILSCSFLSGVICSFIALIMMYRNVKNCKFP